MRIIDKGPGSPGLTGYYMLRQDLMMLADEVNGHRLQFLETLRKMTEVVAELTAKAEKLFPRALAEVDSNGVLRNEYKPKTDVHTVREHVREQKLDERRLEKEQKLVGRVRPLKHGDVPTELAAKIMEKTVKKRRVMKPLTEEQKQKRRESLVKARAARVRRTK